MSDEKTLCWVGKVSVFGGPNDTGVTLTEGLALFEESDLEKPIARGLFLGPFNDRRGVHAGLARRLDPSGLYIAMRWNYNQTPRSYLQRVTIIAKHGDKAVKLRPVDWGPNIKTGRVADLSPGAAKFLGLATDDVCEFWVPLP